MPSKDSLSIKALPIGLAHNVKITKTIKKGEVVSRTNVSSLKNSNALLLRKEMEQDLGFVNKSL